VYAWHVPLLTIDLSAFSSRNVSSDLTLQRILPYVNGITSVAHISQLADTDLGLTRKAIQHLVYYGCVILLDIFQFGAVYAPTAEIGNFVVDESTQEECAHYVQMPLSSPAAKSIGSVQTDATGATPTTNQQQRAPEMARSTARVTEQRSEITGELLVKLYTSLKQGLILRNWCLENMDLLAGIDVRRLITFGVIKGFLYRVHKYAIATSSGISGPEKLEQSALSFRIDETKASRRPSAGDDDQIHDVGMTKAGKDLPLEKFLDGIHSFDEICTELRMNEREVLGKIKGFGDVQIISR
jgi:nitrogen permease regulator 2-like protein